VVGRPPVGSGAQAGCCRAAPGCSNERRRLPRARHRIVSRLISSRDPAANLRPVSRSAATAFSLSPSEQAREPVRLPDPAAVSRARQAQAPPPVRRHSPRPSLRPVPSSRSASAASRLQPANPDCVPHPSPSLASQVALGGLYRHVMCGPPELSETRTRQGPRVRVVGFPQAHRPSVPRSQYPWHTGRQCPIAQRSVSCHLLASARTPCGGGAGLGRDRPLADSWRGGGRPAGHGPGRGDGGRMQATRGSRARERWCTGPRPAEILGQL
jgi:hypothetical protein